MRRGNPNQARIVRKLRSLGYNVRVKHNQIHIEGVRKSPFPEFDNREVPEGDTYGMTIREAEEFMNGLDKPLDQKFLEQEHKGGADD